MAFFLILLIIVDTTQIICNIVVVESIKTFNTFDTVVVERIKTVLNTLKYYITNN